MNFNASSGLPETANYALPKSVPSSAYLAYSYPGLGLPATTYVDVIALLKRIQDTTTSELTCDDSPGGICKLDNVCSDYNKLWDYSFYLKFSVSDNYIIVPLAALALDVNSKCELWISSLDQSNPVSDAIVLGSLFLQQFDTSTTYHYDNSTQVTWLQISQTTPFENIYIGNQAYGEAAFPFKKDRTHAGDIAWVCIAVLLCLIGVCILGSSTRKKSEKLDGDAEEIVYPKQEEGEEKPESEEPLV